MLRSEHVALSKASTIAPAYDAPHPTSASVSTHLTEQTSLLGLDRCYIIDHCYVIKGWSATRSELRSHIHLHTKEIALRTPIYEGSNHDEALFEAHRDRCARSFSISSDDHDYGDILERTHSGRHRCFCSNPSPSCDGKGTRNR